ncbi:MAG: hypothetical protein OEW29_12960 [Acidimicrobiia bacterium]|nr:hypothetical protein [Acidimicrobiia bacterium]
MSTDQLAAAFPIVVVAALVVVLVLALRLDRRLSRGAYSAGPWETERPAPPGQERTPWELKAIDDQLILAAGAGGAAVPRYDLTATVNRLITAAGLPPREQLPLSANLQDLSAAIGLIEDRLGLAPLTADPGPRTPATQRAAEPSETPNQTPRPGGTTRR